MRLEILKIPTTEMYLELNFQNDSHIFQEPMI